MEEAFRALLTSASAVTALVPASRINFGKHPQGADLPGIVLNVASDGITAFTLDGASIYDARIQVDIYAKTYAAAKAVQRAVLARLEAYQGTPFQMIGLLVMSDRAEDVDTQPPLHRVIMDFRAVYTA